MIKYKKQLINWKLALKQNTISLILKNLNLIRKILKFTLNTLNKALKKDHLKLQVVLMVSIVLYINYIILIKEKTNLEKFYDNF